MKNEKGISLIVLVITIVVIIILAGAVILSLVNNNVIENASKAKFLSNVRSYETELQLYQQNEYSNKLGQYNPDVLQADASSVTYNGENISNKTIYDILPSLNSDTDYKDKFIILDGELVYTGIESREKGWLGDVNVKTSTAEPKADFSDAQINVLQKEVKYKVTFSSNYPLSKMNLNNNVKVVDQTNIELTGQPNITIGNLSGTDSDKVRTVDITIDSSTLGDGTYKLMIKSGAVKNSNDIFNTQNIISTSSFSADNIAPINPDMSAEPTGWTNGKVTVTITYTSDSSVKEYSLDGSTWQAYINPIEVTENSTTVYSRAADVSGNQSGQSTLTVANIDKAAPTVEFGTNGSNDIKEASTIVTLTDVGGSNIDPDTLQYVWNIQDATEPTAGWTTFTNGGTITKNSETGTYYLWIKGSDYAGNVVVAKSNAFGIDNTAPINPSMAATPTSWTNSNVTVTITYPSDAAVKEYSLDGTTWNVYTSLVSVSTNNTTVYAKATDAAGNQSGQSTLTVANIDKVTPTVAFGTNGALNVQNASTTVTVNDAGGSNINASTLQYVWDIQNASTPSSGWATFTNGGTINKNNITGTYYLWIKGSDNAGNEIITKSNAFGIDNTAPVNPSMSATPTGWTNSNVTVTITYPSDAATKQYSLDGTSWNSYTSALTITSNLTVYAKAIDAAGNQSGQSTLTVSNIDKAAPAIANALAGTGIYSDPTFTSGINSTVVYNNTGDGAVTVNRIAIPSSPTGSGYGLEIKTTSGTPWPGWGGFYFGTMSSANKVFISKIIAKIPVEYSINWSTNAFGNGGTCEWLTSQAGTGNWTEYICKVTCGSSGSFSTTNFYYITGGSTPTPAAPAVWQVAYANVFDTTRWGTSNIVMASATDASGVVGYGINQSSSTAPTFTSIAANTKFATVFDNITANGTYYVWLKDQAGNITNSPATVSYVDRTAPNITAGNGGSNETSLTVTATATDAGGSGLNSSSYQYSKDNGATWTSATSATSYTFTGLSIGIYQCKVKVADNVGNSTESNAIEIATQGLVGKFSFSGSIINEVTNKTYTGTGISYATGRTGNGLRIVNGQVRVPLSELAINTNTNTISVAFWFNWNGEDGIMPIGFYAHDAWISGGYFGYNTGNNDVYGINNPFIPGTFMHVTLIFNKGDYTLNSIYINGVKQVLSQKRTTQAYGNTQFVSSINISGWEADVSYWWNGSTMDDLKIYNRVLTDAEVVQIMNQ